jgi:hypothetical protein
MRINLKLCEENSKILLPLEEKDLSLKLKFCETKSRVKLAIKETGLLIKFKFTDKFVNIRPDYTGDYTVTPTFNIQKLLTKDRLMNDDVTVYSIPLSEVTNPQDGITITVGA